MVPETRNNKSRHLFIIFERKPLNAFITIRMTANSFFDQIICLLSFFILLVT